LEAIESSPSTGKSVSPWLMFWFGGLLVMLAGVPVWVGLWRLWFSNEVFNGLVLVPILACIVLLARRKQLAKVDARPVPTVCYAIHATLVLMLSASFAGQARLAGILLVVCLGLLGLRCLGKEIGRMLLVPYLFMLLMIPPHDHIVDSVTLALQKAMTLLANGWFAIFSERLIGSDGSDFYFAQYDGLLEIGPECSGVRSLLGMIVAALFFAAKDRLSFLKTVFLTVGAMGVALSFNFIRVLVTMQLHLDGWKEYASGGWHGLFGMFVFVMGIATIQVLCNHLSSAFKNKEVTA